MHVPTSLFTRLCDPRSHERLFAPSIGRSSTSSKRMAGFAGIALGLIISASALAQTSTMVIVGKDSWLFPGWGSLTTVDVAGVDSSVTLIQAARDALAKRGVQLVVLMLPDKTLFYSDKLPAGKVLSPEVRVRYQTIQGKLTKAGIKTFDDERVLRSLAEQGQDVFYRTDQHWTQVAADASAVATAQLVKQVAPQLKGSPGSGMTLGADTTERRYGDMAELFLTPAQRTTIGREAFKVRKTSAGQSLIDDSLAPVHVTGHSMVQPYFGFPQKLSQQLDRPVSVNWKPGNVGPWIMLMEYLESPDFKKNTPQVLVWQVFEPTFSQGPNAAGMWDNASIMTADTWRTRLLAATRP